MKTNMQTGADARIAPIRPEILAGKLAAIRNYEHPALLKQITERPRLVELLWFIQAMSLQPGGLLKFAEELLTEFPERLGTPTMRAAKGKAYTLGEKIAIRNELPRYQRPHIDQEGEDILGVVLSDRTPAELAAMDARDRRALQEGLKNLNADYFKSLCRRAALEKLPQYLFALCTEKNKELADSDEAFARSLDAADTEPGARETIMAAFGDGDRVNQPAAAWPGPASETWYFNDVIGAILELMDRRAAQIQKRLAMTEVARLVFDALDFALAEKVMVRIEGASRFGKTEAMETWCDMRPGLARLVRVPCSNSMSDFFKRIGEALGIDCSYGSNPSRLKERIEYIIQHSGLFLVLDEGAFLIPQNYSATTPPHRLNWVRTEIVDRNLPLAIAVTPQAFKSAVERFVKKTSYTMEQYFGRNFLTRVLPSSLGEKDMIAVARIHFPELDEDALGYIASEARLSQNYLQAVEAIARRARFLAGRRKGRITLRDIETAIAEVLPRRQPATEQPAPIPATNRQGGTKRAQPAHLRPVNEPLKAGSRGMQPAMEGSVSDSILGNRSLRAAGPEGTEAELISAES